MAAEVNVGTLEAVLTLVDQMSGPLGQVVKSLDQFKKQMVEADGAQVKTQQVTRETGGALTALGVMFANLAANYIMRATDALIGFAKQSVTTAAEVKMLGHVAEFMGEKFGMTKDQVHAVVQQLNAQGITMRQANDTVIQFAKSQLDLGKATQLAALAQSAARIGNMNSSAALQRLIYGIQTQQTETLRTVGIVISMEKATQEYARTLGKSAKELTGSERQQAAFNAVLKEGEKISGVYGVTMKDAAGKMQSMTRLIEDASVKIGMVFQPAYEKGVEIMYAFWKAVAEGPEKFLALGAAIAFVGTALHVSWLLPVTLALGALDLLIGMFTGSLDPIENFKTLISFLGGVFSAFFDVVKYATFGIVDFKEAFKNADGAIYAVAISLNEVTLFLNYAKLGFETVARGAYVLELALSKMAARVAWGDKKKELDEHIAATEKQIEALGKASGATMNNIDALRKQHEAIVSGTDATDKNAKGQKSLKERVEEGVKAWQASLAALQKQKEEEEKVAAETARHAEAVKNLTKTLTDVGRAKVAAEAIKDLRGTIAGVGGTSKLTLEELQRFTAEMVKLGPQGKAAADQLTAAWEKENGGIQVLTNSVRKFNELVAVPPKYLTFDEKVSAQAEQIKKQLDAQTESINVQKAAIDKLYADGQISGAQYDSMLKQVGIDLSANVEQTDEWAEKFTQLAEAAAMFANLFGGGLLSDLAGMISANAQGVANYRDQMKDLSTALKDGKISQEQFNAAKFAAQIGVAANAAGMLGGMLQKSTNATMQQAGAALQGAAAGAKMGASFGPLGAAIGGVIGGIAGFINKGKQLRAEVTKLYDEFVKTNGGMEALKAKAEAAGVSLEAVMKNKGTKNVAAMKKAIEEATAKLDAFDDLLSKVGVKGLEDLKAKAMQAGISLQAIWDAKSVEDYKKACEDVGKQFDLWNEANDKLNSAMEKYGITIEQLGPKMRQQKLDEQAATLYQDWQLLLGAGVDMNVLIEKMGPSMMSYVDTAVRAGATIPEAMKPAIDAMWEQGKLIHENGEAYTEAEYEALKYGKTQAEMFDALIEKITQLVNALLGIPSEVNTDVNVRRHEYPAGAAEDTEGTGTPGRPPEEHSYASGSSWKDFGAGTVAMLHGIERVQTPSQAQAESMSQSVALQEAVARQTQELKKAFRDAVAQYKA